MLADPRSLEALDFARVRERVAGQTHAAQAHVRALAMEPTSDIGTVRRLVTETAEMRTLVRNQNFSLSRIEDVEASLEIAERGSSLPPGELRAVADALAAGGAAVRAIREAEAIPGLRDLTSAFRALPNVVTRITDAIDERGSVLDRASPELARVRRQIAHAQDDARDRTAALTRSAKYARAIQDAIVTLRNGRYVIPVKAEFAGEFPGIVHDTSATGQTLFIEPLETLETNNRVRALRAAEEHEVARILAELSALAGGEAVQIRTNVTIYVDLDLAFARAAVADRMNAVEPTIVDAAVLDVHDGRHPLLDDRAVPQSITLDDDVRVTIISGPNMGGKTVTLKMAGLFVVMAGCGMHVPAVSATIGRFTRVFTDIGDDQSIAQNTSTFSAHLGRLAEIVAQADARSLILIDEIGSGTDPNAGAALAVALLERFLEVGACAIVTTHATELKLFGAERAHVRNASVRFDPQTYAPTYQLDLGSPGQSLAFPLARAMHLDLRVIERAEALLSEQERDYERALAELAVERERTSAERAGLATENKRLRALEDAARQRVEALERERRTFTQRAEAQLAAALRGFSAELERRAAGSGERTRAGRVTRGQSELLGRTIDEMRAGLGITRTVPAAPEPPAPTGIAVGDRVRVRSLDTEGVVVEDFGTDVMLQLGALRMTVPKSDLTGRQAAAAPRPAHDGGAAKLAAATAARNEIDVRGKRFVDAQPIVEQWIDESMLAGASPLRLIHGKGTGLLGRGLQQYLRAHANVRDVRFGNAEEGGSGVTVFELK
ncbi:MAG TPA: endonuclease MutS2 [Candidatus Lustribacter sp.]|nr:endonuclease MutS2 [Candidatus Lustribacter sp.]